MICFTLHIHRLHTSTYQPPHTYTLATNTHIQSKNKSLLLPYKETKWQNTAYFRDCTYSHSLKSIHSFASIHIFSLADFYVTRRAQTLKEAYYWLTFFFCVQLIHTTYWKKKISHCIDTLKAWQRKNTKCSSFCVLFSGFCVFFYLQAS